MSGRKVAAETTIPPAAPVSPSNIKAEPDGKYYVYVSSKGLNLIR